MPTTGQFWYLTQGTAADSRLVYIDINASSASGGSNTNGPTNIFVDNNPTTDLQTNFTEDMQVDWATVVYFVLVNVNPTLGTGGEVLMGHLNSSVAPVVVYTAPVSDVVNTLQLDVYSHHLYVQHA